MMVRTRLWVVEEISEEYMKDESEYRSSHLALVLSLPSLLLLPLPLLIPPRLILSLRLSSLIEENH